MVKAWFPISELQNKVGTVVDTYANIAVELYCEENKEYYIRQIKDIEIIK